MLITQELGGQPLVGQPKFMWLRLRSILQCVMAWSLA